MKRRPRAKHESITQVARAIYRAAYGEPMPKGWTVVWVGFMRGAMGMCYYGSKRILLSRADHAPRRRKVAVTATEPYDGRSAYNTRTCEAFIGYASALDQYTENACVIHTLCHEFTHLRWGRGLRHGADFERLVDAAYARVWEAAR